MKKYEHKKIEKKWREIWAKTDLYKTDEDPKKPKFYCLDMFPYPSGAGLHVGHPKGYIATDVYSRMKRLQGYKVLHPMGWDAFGLPTENYAIKNKINPRIAAEENIKRFKDQLELIGFNHDWDREINTTDPEYYKWTQWIFVKLFEKGLAYQSWEPINWCPSCKTGLSLEDLEEGHLCERCGGEVEQRPMRQWVLKMTDYADRLLDDLKLLDWEEQIIEQQRNWIGRSEGAKVNFQVVGKSDVIEVFTTRIDTLYGATFMVLAPEHPLVNDITEKKQKSEVEKYRDKAKKKTDLARMQEKVKTGVFTGAFAINPINNEKIPVWVSDYVLMGYGTGAIMAVPAHDERDFEFAAKYKIPVKEVIAPYWLDEENPPDPQKETEKREVVCIIVRNPKDNKYLVLKWSITGWQSFPTGGTDGEELVTAAKREFREETGYKNLKFIKQIPGSSYAEFYRPHKGSNVIAHFHYLVFDLENEEQDKVEEKEKNTHKAMWIAEKEVEKYLNVANQQFAWKRHRDERVIFSGYGTLIDSGEYTGLTSEEAKEAIINKLSKENGAQQAVSYKMKDWVFSRQRYWGEPIPIVHCEKCGPVALPEDQLPLTLPEVKSYEPSGTGESPLAKMTDWVNTTCPKCGGSGKRETDTMPQWAGSSWYYLRYIDPKNHKQLIDPKKEKEWMPVDLYVGGIEHATRHLLYARFWHKFLYDIGVVSTTEPFKKLIHVGLILAEDGRKMSKRWSNVINPNDIVEEYGADSLRLYEMFMGPFTQYIAWSTKGVKGARRFLEKVSDTSNFFQELGWSQNTNNQIAVQLNKTIKKVTEDIEDFRFNTAIASMMTFINFLNKEKDKPETNIIGQAEWISREDFGRFITLLGPFAPHLAEEIWSEMGQTESIFLSGWPSYDKNLIIDEVVTIPVQINGKIRDQLIVARGSGQDEVLNMAKDSGKVKKYLENTEIVKVFFIPDKLLSLVTK
jgi:leucyl-tRNA synthetase